MAIFLKKNTRRVEYKFCLERSFVKVEFRKSDFDRFGRQHFQLGKLKFCPQNDKLTKRWFRKRDFSSNPKTKSVAYNFELFKTDWDHPL